MTRGICVGSTWIGEDEPLFILAEIASAHQGSPDQALALARAAKEAGASGVKIQLFRAEELIAPNDPRMETFRQIELSTAEWERLLDELSELEIPILADVFDRPSLSIGEKHGVKAYKIHSTDMENPAFIREVAATGKPLLLSTGGCALDDVETAIEVAGAEGNEEVMLLHGVQNFPTRIEDSHLRFIETLKETYGLPVGFLDHVDGGSPMALVLPALALAFGADLIEKHVTLDRAAKGFDYESALEPETFGKMVQQLREVEKAFGTGEEPREESAEKYHKMMRRAVLAREALRKDKPIRAEQLVYLRSDKGVAPKYVTGLIGRKPRREIEAWEPLTEDLFE